MKKLLYLPLLVPGGAHEQHDLLAAFRKVYEVEVLDHIAEEEPNKRLVELIESFRPDIIHIQASDKIAPEVIATAKKAYPSLIITQWTGDCRPEPIPLIVKFGKVCDATLLATGHGQREMYQKATKKPVFWWQHAVALWQFRPVHENPSKHDVVMVGNNYDSLGGSAERVALAQGLTINFEKAAVYGSGYPDKIVRCSGSIPWDKQTHYYSQSKVSAGTNAYNDVALYFSDRPIIAMAAGSCHLMRYVPELETIFTDNDDCVFWRTVEEAVDKAKYLLTHPSERLRIARNGQKKVAAYHTFDYRVKEYQEILEQL